MSDFVSLQTALSGILAARVGVQTTSHNVANAGSTGYTRQRSEQVSRDFGHPTLHGVIGTGADVTSITRARDGFLDLRIRAGLSNLAGFDVRTTLLERMEQALAEPELGVSQALSATWDSFEALSLEPTDYAARQNVLSNLDALAARVRSVSAGWEQLGRDTRTSLEQATAEVNRLLGEIGTINDAIARSAGLAATNDLHDRRDLALDRLAELIGATSAESDDGTFRVSVNGVGLVDGTTVRELTFNPSDLTIRHPSGVAVGANGAVAEWQQFLAVDLPARKGDLDQFVEELATALNARHSNGWWSDTSTGDSLLAWTPGSASSTIALALTDPHQIAVAADPGPPFPVHDGSNATAMADLRHDLVAGGGTLSLEQKWRSFVTELGVSVATARDAAAVHRGLHHAADLARRGAHGVSVDEEMVSLIQFQHAFEASARVMSAVDELLDVLITRTGLVGR